MARKARNNKGYFTETIELPRGPNGERRRKFVRSKTAAGLKDKVQQAYATLEAGDLPVKARDGMTLGAWLQVWLEQEAKRGKLAPGTMDEYRRNVTNHITPKLGTVLVAELKAKQVQRFIDKLELEPRTVRNILSPLIDALDAAIFEELCRENVARAVTLPELNEPELYQLSPEELQAFLAAIAGDRFEALYWLAMLGPRAGELLALRLEDFNAADGTITIRGGVRRLSQDEGSSKLRRIKTKTKNSERTIRLPPQWIAVMRAHLARLEVEQGTERWKEHGLLFPSTVGTLMERQNLANRSFKPALTRAGLPADLIRFHDLRHAAAAMLIALKYDARTVSEILGHASPEFTLKQYAYAFAAVKDRAVADVGELLGAAITIPSKVPKGSE